jgi:hypothetical protein
MIVVDGDHPIVALNYALKNKSALRGLPCHNTVLTNRSIAKRQHSSMELLPL